MMLYRFWKYFSQSSRTFFSSSVRTE